jgi:hypothetical protein
MLKGATMKRFLLVIMALASCALSAVSIQNIRAKDYSGVVCRLVLTMDQDVDFTVNQQGNDYLVTISNLEGQLPNHNLRDTFLEQIELTGDGLKISSSARLRYLTMRLSDTKALVIDFIKFSQSKKERLVIASFLTEMGRLASADKEYEELARDYPDHYDIFYYWGKLLLQRGSARAAQKLAKIPESNSYYPAAQDLLHGTKSSSQTKAPAEETPKKQDEEPVLIQEEAELQAEAETDLELNESPSQDSIIFIIPSEEVDVQKPGFLSSLAAFTSRYILFTIPVFVVILVILAYFIFRKSRISRKKPHQDIEESSFGMDTDTVCKMVHSLLADGWTNKEIAKELKISLQGIESIVHRLHYMEISENADKKE